MDNGNEGKKKSKIREGKLTSAKTRSRAQFHWSQGPTKRSQPNCLCVKKKKKKRNIKVRKKKNNKTEELEREILELICIFSKEQK